MGFFTDFISSLFIGEVMQTVTLTRAYKTGDVTLGMLQIKDLDHDPIYTLENPWLGNQDWISCIPTGTYECVPYSSEKYPDVYKVVFVKDRDDILFHWGNYERNTAGCILLGLGSMPMKDEPAIQRSKDAVKYFRSLMGDERFILVIK